MEVDVRYAGRRGFRPVPLPEYSAEVAQSQAEIDFQAGALGRGASRVQLATNFLNANKFRISSGPRLTAFLACATVLGRVTDTREMRRPVDRLTSSGLTGAELWNELTRAAEYSLPMID